MPKQKKGVLIRTEKQRLLEFSGNCCPSYGEHTVDNYRTDLNEMKSMLQHFMDLDSKAEIAFCRRAIQETKEKMREAIRIQNNLCKDNIMNRRDVRLT